jgi:hypothetical protein
MLVIAPLLWISIALDANWQESLKLECSPEHSAVCRAACGNDRRCNWKQPTCERCSGTSDPSLYAIYREIPTITTGASNQARAFFSQIQSKQWLLFHPTSPYNFFSDPQDPTYQASLDQACQRSSSGTKGLALVATRSLERKDRPWSAAWLLCIHERYGAQVFRVNSEI